MKNLFFLLIAVVAMASMTSCSDTDEFQPDSSMVKVSITPSFSSGSLTRTTTTDMYTQMQKKIASELLAESYYLVFTETSSGKTYTFTGNWGNSILIKSGTYKVVGTSTAVGDYIQEKGSLKFDTVVTIKPSDTRVILDAEWDCFLLLFNKSTINKVSVLYGINSSKVEEKSLFEIDNIIYCFSKRLFNENSSAQQLLVIDYIDNSRETLSTRDKVFETGKYYSFDGNIFIKSGVSIPMMTQGNI